MHKRAKMIGLTGALVLAVAGSTWAAAAKSPIGRWNLTVDDRPAWLAIERQGNQYIGRFLGSAGSVAGIGEVKIDGMNIQFNAHDRKWVGTVDGDNITGTWEKGQEKGKWSGTRSITRIDVKGTWTIRPMGVPVERPAVVEFIEKEGKLAGTYKEGDKKYEVTNIELKTEAAFLAFAVEGPAGRMSFVGPVLGDIIDGMMDVGGRRGHKLMAYRQRQWGEPIELFNGKDLNNWEQFGDLKNKNWKVVDGVMTTTGGANIVSKEKFRDFRLHVEFMVPPGGNSGVYLRGRHEIQVADSIGSTPPTWHDCGALYSRIAPAVNACGKADTWQTFDITLINKYLTVIFNGQIIIDNQEVEGITGGMLDCKENDPGPIYLQGDHGKISYRKITVWPAK